MRLIDADALKEQLSKETNIKNLGLWLNILQIIDNAPTVTPERPQGKWIMQTYYDGFTYWECSNCGKKNEFEVFEFCPNCGARMASTDRDCENCVHHIDGKGCESWECEFEKRSDL